MSPVARRFLLALLLTGCRPSAPDPAESASPAVSVRTVALAPVRVPERLSLPATVVALPEHSGGATPTQAARVLSLSVQVGDRVRAGQRLASLQMEPLAEADALKAQQAEALAAREAGRQTRLYAAGVAPRAQLDQAQVALATARADRTAKDAALRLARANAQLTAPLSGTVSAVNGSVGALADPTRPLVAIVDLDHLGVSAEADAATLMRVKPGLAARLKAPDGHSFAVVSRRVDPAVDAATQRGRILFAADCSAGALKLGMFAAVEATLGTRRLLRVPLGAVVPRDGAEAVFVVRDGQAHERRVRLGPPVEGHREVLAGLAPGEHVVVEGAYGLSEGAAVEEHG